MLSSRRGAALARQFAPSAFASHIEQRHRHLLGDARVGAQEQAHLQRELNVLMGMDPLDVNFNMQVGVVERYAREARRSMGWRAIWKENSVTPARRAAWQTERYYRQILYNFKHGRRLFPVGDLTHEEARMIEMARGNPNNFVNYLNRKIAYHSVYS